MSETNDFHSSPSAVPPRLQQICERFEHAWRIGPPPRIVDYLGEANGEERLILLRKLVQIDILFRRRQGQNPRLEDYQPFLPMLDSSWLVKELAANPVFDQGLPTISFSKEDQPGETKPADDRGLPLYCPHCCNLMSLHREAGGAIVCPGCGSSFRLAFLDQPTTPDETKLLGRFRLLTRVGQGSYGSVWRAHDTQLQREVALKIPHASLLSSSEYLERIQREARAAAQLRHPGIVRLYEVASIGEMPVLVSDFIDGVPLKDLLEVKRLTFTETATLIAEAAEALHYAHGRGLIHRDIKPGNIMIEFARSEEATGTHRSVGKPILVDFGLALREEAEIVMTLEGQIIGTPAYMSPEQAAGQGHKVDRRSDVYSLGVVFYQILCGELPFRGSKAMLVHQVLHEEPRPPRRVNDKIPRDLETICLTAMAKEPSRRYATAGELAADLRRFLRGEPIQARPVGRVERLWRWCRRNPTVASLTAAVASSLVIGTITASYFAVRAGRGEEEALRQADRARQARLLSEWRRYDAEINLAQRAWQNGQIALVQDLLRAQEPNDESTDLRGFEWYHLQRLCRADLGTLVGHDKPIRCLVFSPDGRWLASAGEDGTVRLWDMASEKETRILKGNGETITSIAWSANGQRLASASGGYAQDVHPLAGEVKVWDPTTGKELLTIHGEGPLQSLAFSPDGQRLVAAGAGARRELGPAKGRVTIWDAATGKEVLVLASHETPVQSVALSPDGRHGASGSSDGTVLVWDAHTGTIVWTLSGHTAPVLSLDFSPDSRRLASAGWDRTARVWDLNNGKELRKLPEQADAVFCVAFGRAGGQLASASRDQTVKVWDAITLAERFTLRGHTNAVYSVVFSPDHWRLASAGADQAIKIWSVLAPDPPLQLRGHRNTVNQAVFSSDGRSLASASEDRTVRLWDADRGLLTATLYGHSDAVWDVAFSPDGRLLASAGKDRRVQLWNTTTGEVVRVLFGHTKPVTGTAFSPDSRLLASSSEDATVRLWDTGTGGEQRSLRGHTGSVRGVAFSPDGSLLASAGDDGMVKFWNVRSWEEMRTLRGHTGSVRGISFSQDARLLASAGEDGNVILWSASTGERLLQLRGHSVSVNTVAFSPDGSRLASGSLDRSITIWDTHTGQALCTLREAGAIFSVAFSRDGQQLAATGEHGSVQIWNAVPLTANLRDKRQALSLIESLFNRGLPPMQIRARLGEDRTIREAVRQQALDLVEPYGRGLLRRHADEFLNSLSKTFPLKTDLLEKIRTHPALNESQRLATLALAEHYVESTIILNARSRSISRLRFQDAAAYHLALRYAQAACRREPRDGSCLNTLGMAQYRVGKYQEAVATLRQANLLNAADSSDPQAADLAFLTMALFRLGQKEEAQATLHHLRDVMRVPPWSKQREAQDYLREAEEVVAGPTKKGER